MSATYLHGIETVELTVGPVQVQQVKSAIIGLVGTAPIQTLDAVHQTINSPVLISSDRDAAAYAGDGTLAGYSLPAALRAIQAAGAGTVVMVNVFDPAKHKDAQGKPDPSKVTAADIVGAVGADGTRTGAQLFVECMSLFGCEARILLAPGFSELATVSTALEAIAGKCKGVALVDLPVGATVQQAIQGRGANGALALTSTSDRVVYCYPHVKVLAADGSGNLVLEPLSQHLAGVMAWNDLENGYWWSPSNKTLPLVKGLELALTSRINDASCDVNLLNGAGILSVFSAWGKGFKTWGNRSAAFPGVNDPTTFISTRRTLDVIDDSLTEAQTEFMDHPIRRGLIDTLVETGNAFIRTLKGRGAVDDGEFVYDSTRNSATELAAGHLVLTRRVFIPSPMERLTNEAYLDINLASIK
jgi:uncharacterized protein